MKANRTTHAPTNAEIVHLLEAVQAAIHDLKQGQEEIARTLKAAPGDQRSKHAR